MKNKKKNQLRKINGLIYHITINEKQMLSCESDNGVFLMTFGNSGKNLIKDS